MRTKKFAVILVAIVFILVMLFSCIALFTVKKVQVNYAVSDNTDTFTVQGKLNEYLGKNLLFLNTDDVKSSISDFHYMEVLSVDKQFPNIIKVEIKERREIYDVVQGDKVYVTTDDGLKLREYDYKEGNESRERITLKLNGITISETKFGERLVTDGEELLDAVFEMAKSVRLTDCIKNVEIQKGIENETAIFQTYTGVKIIVREILDDGIKKIETAFEKYDEVATDYEKTFKVIETVKTADGNIVVVYPAN